MPLALLYPWLSGSFAASASFSTTRFSGGSDGLPMPMSITSFPARRFW
jgi:hypothetical protein